MLQAPKQQLAAGDRAPNFVLPDYEGKFRMFYDRVSGRSLVLLFCQAFQPPILPAPLLAFQAGADRLEAEELDVFCITPADSGPAHAMLPNLQIWSDREGKISEAYLGQVGLGGSAALKGGNVVGVLMDSNQRVLTVISGKTGDLAAKVKLIAVDEMRHAEMFAERIKELDGEPIAGHDNVVERGRRSQRSFHSMQRSKTIRSTRIIGSCSSAATTATASA